MKKPFNGVSVMYTFKLIWKEKKWQTQWNIQEQRYNIKRYKLCVIGISEAEAKERNKRNVWSIRGLEFPKVIDRHQTRDLGISEKTNQDKYQKTKENNNQEATPIHITSKLHKSKGKEKHLERSWWWVVNTSPTEQQYGVLSERMTSNALGFRADKGNWQDLQKNRCSVIRSLPSHPYR